MADPVEPSNADGGLLVFERIVQLLDSAAVGYRSLEHPPTLTSEDSARVRQEPLEVGAKALLLKAAEHYLIVVIPADRKLDSAALKRQLAMKSAFRVGRRADAVDRPVTGSLAAVWPADLSFPAVR